MILAFTFLWTLSSVAAPCLTSNRLCKEREQFIYHLENDSQEFKKACGLDLKIVIEWKSFKDSLDKNEVASITPCRDLVKNLTSICQVDKSSIEKVKSLETVVCKSSGAKRSLALEKNRLVYAANIEHGTKSDDEKPYNAEFVKAELKSVLKVAAVDVTDIEKNKSLKADAERAAQEKQREADHKKQQEEREKQQKQQADQIAAQVKQQNEAAETKTKKYLAKTQELQKWYQDELKKLMDSKIDPNEKSQKMQALGQKYQAELQKAIKEMQGNP